MICLRSVRIYFRWLRSWIGLIGSEAISRELSQYKMLSYQYRNSHYKDKTVLRIIKSRNIDIRRQHSHNLCFMGPVIGNPFVLCCRDLVLNGHCYKLHIFATKLQNFNVLSFVQKTPPWCLVDVGFTQKPIVLWHNAFVRPSVNIPDSKVHGADMGPMNLAIRDIALCYSNHMSHCLQCHWCHSPNLPSCS